MLVLSRRAGERIQIGDQVEVTVVRIGPGVVRIGVEAPQQMQVLREEVRHADRIKNLPASTTTEPESRNT
jgi:carbon storage regulator